MQCIIDVLMALEGISFQASPPSGPSNVHNLSDHRIQVAGVCKMCKQHENVLSRCSNML